MNEKSGTHSQRAKEIARRFSKSLKYPINHQKAQKKAKEKAESDILLAVMMQHDAGRPVLPNSYDRDPK